MATRAAREAKKIAPRGRKSSDDPALAERRAYMARYLERPGKRERLRVQRVESYLRLKFGITIEQRDALLAAQRGKCALCGMPIRFSGRAETDSAHLDHCHVTGKIRGVLCSHCNTALGKLGDTVEALERAVKYLRGEK